MIQDMYPVSVMPGISSTVSEVFIHMHGVYFEIFFTFSFFYLKLMSGNLFLIDDFLIAENISCN